MISKKLFSKIMDINEEFIEYITIEDDGGMICKFHCTPNELHKTEFNKHLSEDYYNTKQDFYKEMSIFEFAFKCKGVAFRNGYNILTDCFNKELTEFDVYVIKDFLVYSTSKILNDTDVLFECEASSEIEGIIKASEWIVNSLDK